LRFRSIAAVDDAPTVRIEVNGKPLRAREGQLVAMVLLEAGLESFNMTRTGESRRPYCLMGACFDCRLIIDGQRDRLGCMHRVHAGMIIETQDDEIRES
jgi:NADH dehydrogenase/NADH:ubiquinone oxidoreductase subunit G